ncbi:hypothetical protein BDN70DRAFT_912402 [Pholiota conissans]|uniref:Uncharacterized protein n=1 Tax=Pholiota conissans TaxID=109636 RepID=A0A9P5Z493_9AGAR|nr:hypothetical protein BDN70DRAFT_912402 [Pholiota conissans]
MPVHFKVAPHDANEMKNFRSLETADQLLHQTWGAKDRRNRSAEVLQTSYGNLSDIAPTGNGFVNTVKAAYNQHYHLIIKPDDVWMAILAQFNFYVNAHAEDLRHMFVTHEGKKELVIGAVGSRHSVDFGALAVRMTKMIDENVIDKDLRDWILPDFSTTTVNNKIVCAVYMMATLKEYFSYRMMLSCGIPSVILEGEKSDWEKLLSRIDKLREFGMEPEAWAFLLRPILSRFVNAFDGNHDIERGSGMNHLSGWITAFCVWNSKGTWRGPSPIRTISHNILSGKNVCVLDGVEYGRIDANNIPPGFCEVDVKLNDNGAEFDCMMVSGHLAWKAEGDKKDTVRPKPGWFMFVKKAEAMESDGVLDEDI